MDEKVKAEPVKFKDGEIIELLKLHRAAQGAEAQVELRKKDLEAATMISQIALNNFNNRLNQLVDERKLDGNLYTINVDTMGLDPKVEKKS